MTFKTVPTPNYVLTEEFRWGVGVDVIVMEPRTFVRPIDDRWVPKHVLDDPKMKHRAEGDVFCSTPRCGIILIPSRIIRKV